MKSQSRNILKSIVHGAFLIIISVIFLVPLPHFGDTYAGPVEWKEVPSTKEGNQFWDAGSIRKNKQGYITVLTRFLPSSNKSGNSSESLYTMQMNCEAKLYRDTSINGIPRIRPAWKSPNSDGLINAVIDEVCATDLT